MHATDAARVLEAAASVELRAASLKTVVAKRAADAQEWAQRGHRSPEDWLAHTTGTAYGQAAGTIDASEKLERPPQLEPAVRDGELSGPKLNELASAATPENEKRLLDASKKQSCKQLRRTCANEKASQRSAERDEARHERIHRERYYRSHTDADGAYCFEGKATAAAGARTEAQSAYRLDALVNLICEGGATVDTTVVIHVDEARLGGEEGLCEAVATGAVPVSEAIGAIRAGAFVKIVLSNGVDITKVSHHGRHIPEVLRTAILERDGYTCVRPGCWATSHLEIHHWRVPHARGGPMAYWNAASCCPHDPDSLTHGGHRLEGGPGNWTWIPPPRRGPRPLRLRIRRCPRPWSEAHRSRPATASAPSCRCGR
jgi:hypothetical protein